MHESIMEGDAMSELSANVNFNNLGGTMVDAAQSDPNSWGSPTLKEIRRAITLAVTATARLERLQRSVNDRAADARRQLTDKIVTLSSGGDDDWRVIAISPQTLPLCEVLYFKERLPELPVQVTALAATLLNRAKPLLATASKAHGLRGVFAGRESKAQAELATAELIELLKGLAVSDFIPEIEAVMVAYERTSDWNADDPNHFVTAAKQLDARRPAALEQISDPATFNQQLLELRKLGSRIEAERSAALQAAQKLQEQSAKALIAEMSVDRIQDVTSSRLRTSLLSQYGIRTIRDVQTAGISRISQIRGVSETGARQIVAAADAIWRQTLSDTRLTINVATHPTWTRALLEPLRAWHVLRSAYSTSQKQQLAKSLANADTAFTFTGRLLMLTKEKSSAQLMQLVSETLAESTRAVDAVDSTSDVLQDFLARPSEYFSWLDELGVMRTSDEDTTGGLPSAIAERVRSFDLDSSGLKVSLRGYQVFAAKFALVEKKVIIGDEMGLGKTVEALAALCHLQANGSRHFLVVCPASVISNWVREIAAKTSLRGFRLHGPNKGSELNRWSLSGGVAVATYEGLDWLIKNVSSGVHIVAVVIDEAHYIKNPDALRSQRSDVLARFADYAILLTGTPLENSASEFRSLVQRLRPQLKLTATDFQPTKFRTEVAPAYLRRTQQAVLGELPELIETEEWVDFSSRDIVEYRAAVADGNFHRMRKAGLVSGQDSAKIARLTEIVAEAEESGRKVLIFSNYIEVLDAVVAAAPGKVFGPLSGKVAPEKRQHIIDEFTSYQSSAVLVSQIVAGGVGLNIQAASVVIICEPQLKPTTEWQAVARAHRMGQLESVQVHRLYAVDSVDSRLYEILASKSQIFEQFAAESETANASPDAVDVSELQLIKRLVSEEQARLSAER